MNDAVHPALLPLGLRDLLPPDAEIEAAAVGKMMACFARHGYERVKPPLLEFEETLLHGAGAAMAKETFRLMDPISQRMIGLRADMTPQVARIAASRLRKSPRPLRLSYAGQVLRVKGGQLRPERQVGQAGAELIGAEGVAADTEVIALAAEALAAVGVERLTVDLSLPTLVPAVCAAAGVDGAHADAIRAALDHKDAAKLAEVGGTIAGVLGKLLAAAGPARRALKALAAIELPAAAAADRVSLGEVVALLEARLPGLGITVDPVENRGFEYHTGISFTLFARGGPGELGRGGRYIAGNGRPEPATGVTLYTDTVLGVLPERPPPRRLFVPLGGDAPAAARLREDGWVTVAGLAETADPRAEARRLGCAAVLEKGKPAPLD
jgi:ATP phosphoribosyltransferase regulatory subunit